MGLLRRFPCPLLPSRSTYRHDANCRRAGAGCVGGTVANFTCGRPRRLGGGNFVHISGQEPGGTRGQPALAGTQGRNLENPGGEPRDSQL